MAPENPVVHFRLARAYEKAGKLDEAMKSFKAAIRLDPANLEPRRELVTLEIRRKDLPSAEKQCREILAMDRDDQQERQRIIALLGRQKKYGDLTEFLSEETVRYPTDYIAFYRLGIVRDYLKDFQGAIKAFKKSIELKATAKTYHALARTYLRLPDAKKARDALVEAKRLDPQRSDSSQLIDLIDEEYGHSDASPKSIPTINKMKKGRGHAK
jgi:tetratricopeptide (TPR) repeat protein